MNDRFVLLDGHLVPADDAVIPVDDRAILFGDGAYETMRSYGGQFFRFPEHLARLRQTLRGMELELSLSDRAITQGTIDLIEANQVPDARLRLTVTGGSHEGAIRLRRRRPARLILTARALTLPPDRAYREGVDLVLARETIPRDSVLPRIKTINRLMHLMNKERALEEGAWDALFRDDGGGILEGTATNVFFVIDGTLRTASLDQPLLAGVTRDVVLEEAGNAEVPVAEGRITLEEAQGASEAFLTSTTIELLPVRRLAGRPVGSGSRPVWRTLARRYRDAVRRETGVQVGELPGVSA